MDHPPLAPQGDDKTGAELEAQRFQMLNEFASGITADLVFPTNFDVVVRLRKELRKEDWNAHEIAKILAMEPFVSTKVMSLANSSLYSHMGHVKGIVEAIHRLGIEAVRAIALTLAIRQFTASKELACFEDLSDAIWKHTFFTASACYAICESMTELNPDDGLLAGMVHDLGAFYLLYRISQYPELATRPESLVHVLARWHDGIGQTLLQTIGMEEPIVEAVRDHDTTRELTEHPLSLRDVLYLGNIMGTIRKKWMPDEYNPRMPGSILEERLVGLIPRIVQIEQELSAHYA